MSRLTNAVAHAARVFEHAFPSNAWQAMTCTEIEALADIFRAEDRHSVADAIVHDHALDDDDDGDQHHDVYLVKVIGLTTGTPEQRADFEAQVWEHYRDTITGHARVHFGGDVNAAMRGWAVAHGVTL